ncbi:MAG: regulatory protein RecX, partial [Desulfocucumaceae bacterium]
DHQTVNSVISYLKEYGLLNDEAYSEHFVSNKPMRSRAVLEGNLKNLGVEDSIIDKVLVNVDSGAEMRVAMALALGRQKRRGDDYPLVNIAVFLKRRGFSQGIVESVCNCLENMRHP